MPWALSVKIQHYLVRIIITVYENSSEPGVHPIIVHHRHSLLHCMIQAALAICLPIIHFSFFLNPDWKNCGQMVQSPL
jgi:hypothetical protein